MNNDSDLQSNTAMIYQSLEELHALLSTLEEQVKSGTFPAQQKTMTVEPDPDDRLSNPGKSSF